MSAEYFPNVTEEQRAELIKVVDGTALGYVFSESPEGMDYDELMSLLEEEDESLWELNDFIPWEPFAEYPLLNLATELSNVWSSTYATLERALAIVK